MKNSLLEDDFLKAINDGDKKIIKEIIRSDQGSKLSDKAIVKAINQSMMQNNIETFDELLKNDCERYLNEIFLGAINSNNPLFIDEINEKHSLSDSLSMIDGARALECALENKNTDIFATALKYTHLSNSFLPQLMKKLTKPQNQEHLEVFLSVMQNENKITQAKWLDWLLDSSLLNKNKKALKSIFKFQPPHHPSVINTFNDLSDIVGQKKKYSLYNTDDYRDKRNLLILAITEFNSDKLSNKIPACDKPSKLLKKM